MLKHYIRYFYPGAMVSESVVKEVPDRSEPVDMPKGSYGYRFFDVQVEIADDGEVLRGKEKNHSHAVYFGKEKSLEDVREENRGGCLLSNMECNKWDRVVDVGWSAIPLKEGDIVRDRVTLEKQTKE